MAQDPRLPPLGIEKRWCGLAVAVCPLQPLFRCFFAGVLLCCYFAALRLCWQSVSKSGVLWLAHVARPSAGSSDRQLLPGVAPALLGPTRMTSLIGCPPALPGSISSWDRTTSCIGRPTQGDPALSPICYRLDELLPSQPCRRSRCPRRNAARRPLIGPRRRGKEGRNVRKPPNRDLRGFCAMLERKGTPGEAIGGRSPPQRRIEKDRRHKTTTSTGRGFCFHPHSHRQLFCLLPFVFYLICLLALTFCLDLATGLSFPFGRRSVISSPCAFCCQLSPEIFFFDASPSLPQPNKHAGITINTPPTKRCTQGTRGATDIRRTVTLLRLPPASESPISTPSASSLDSISLGIPPRTGLD